MEEKDIEEGNKLIAEFMQIETQVISPYGIGTPRLYSMEMEHETEEGDPTPLSYDCLWDWLMPVVEKIESLDRLGGIVDIKQGQCKITSRMLGDHSVYADKSNYVLMGVKGKLLSTYEAVIEFIKFYNNNNKT